MKDNYVQRQWIGVGASAVFAVVLLFGVVILVLRGYVAIGIGMAALTGFVLATATSIALKASGHARGTQLADWWVRQSANPYSTAYGFWVFAAALVIVAALLSSGLPGTPPDPEHQGLEVFVAIAIVFALSGLGFYYWAKKAS